MRKVLLHLCSLCLVWLVLVSAIPEASANETAPSLSGYIRNTERRHFVEAMLSFHMRENAAVRETLENGYTAVFFFDGCSDYMDDPDLSDLSYYRVSAVCIALKQDESGNPEISYFHDGCSTIPDRPLEYGAWELEAFGEVGPATICDGTYELYSVYHSGYEALHLRTSYEDETIPAVYMMTEGFVNHPANAINIHTRTGNHVIEKAMWSAGCMLVGDGEWEDFTDFIVATYYSNYDRFFRDKVVGCVTVNRQYLKDKMDALYQNQNAVDAILADSRQELPQTYFSRCSKAEAFSEKIVQTMECVQLMSLPCSNAADARSIAVTKLEQGEKIGICGSIVNTKGELWYEVSFFGENCYVLADSVEENISTRMYQIFSCLEN